ncbi:uncharacterized protein PODANS_6_1040 [Podospora anserina S mat+]|uniref:Podospora anserina S mat+ genomic DNA chromosome 6, supercontig 2 n=1 Tax=Podospora anserina (strain S / ATCC MYA-4624 / DSM 980 / FGSC 10383) TaxID=515849 RepID=B2B353_PODAN|nr:uncharacterized protein PODANS_6_1040 [Podospora anserina S mat+]CAP71539.1 unnamed protein product [Podospora anserina S mat+]
MLIFFPSTGGGGLLERLGGEVDGLFLGRFGHDAGEFVKLIGEVAGGGGEGGE